MQYPPASPPATLDTLSPTHWIAGSLRELTGLVIYLGERDAIFPSSTLVLAVSRRGNSESSRGFPAALPNLD